MSASEAVHSAQNHEETTPALAEGSACPTPLNWQDVVMSVREQADLFSLQSSTGAVLNCTRIGEGPPVYFCNPLAVSRDLFYLTLWLLRDDYQCIAWDYPTHEHGQGKPEKQRRLRRHSLTDFATDLLSLFDRLGHQQAMICASGWGCLPAARFCLDHPDRCDRLVLQNAFASRKLSLFERAALRLGTYLPGKLVQLPGHESIHRKNHRNFFPPYDESRWEFSCGNAGQTSIREFARRARLMSSVDLREQFPKLTQKTLLIRTEGEGKLTEREMAELQELIPQATTEWMHTCGQLPFLTHPHRVVKLLREFHPV